MLISSKPDPRSIMNSLSLNSWFLSIILSAVERYVRNVAEDVRDLTTHVNENGKRLLDLDEYSREQSERVKAWHGETETAIHVIGENVLAQHRAAEKQHKGTEDSLNRIGDEVTDHHRESRSKSKQEEKGEKSSISTKSTMRSNVQIR